MDAAGPCKRPILPFFCLVLIVCLNRKTRAMFATCPKQVSVFFSNEVHVCEEAQRVSNYALLLDQDF
jgi:hypothetical protein